MPVKQSKPAKTSTSTKKSTPKRCKGQQQTDARVRGLYEAALWACKDVAFDDPDAKPKCNRQAFEMIETQVDRSEEYMKIPAKPKKLRKLYKDAAKAFTLQDPTTMSDEDQFLFYATKGNEVPLTRMSIPNLLSDVKKWAALEAGDLSNQNPFHTPLPLPCETIREVDKTSLSYTISQHFASPKHSAESKEDQQASRTKIRKFGPLNYDFNDLDKWVAEIKPATAPFHVVAVGTAQSSGRRWIEIADPDNYWSEDPDNSEQLIVQQLAKKGPSNFKFKPNNGVKHTLAMRAAVLAHIKDQSASTTLQRVRRILKKIPVVNEILQAYYTHTEGLRQWGVHSFRMSASELNYLRTADTHTGAKEEHVQTFLGHRSVVEGLTYGQVMHTDENEYDDDSDDDDSDDEFLEPVRISSTKVSDVNMNDPCERSKISAVQEAATVTVVAAVAVADTNTATVATIADTSTEAKVTDTSTKSLAVVTDTSTKALAVTDTSTKAVATVANTGTDTNTKPLTETDTSIKAVATVANTDTDTNTKPQIETDTTAVGIKAVATVANTGTVTNTKSQTETDTAAAGTKAVATVANTGTDTNTKSPTETGTTIATEMVPKQRQPLVRKKRKGNFYEKTETPVQLLLMFDGMSENQVLENFIRLFADESNPVRADKRQKLRTLADSLLEL
jgi:hypothetical protein